MIIRTFITAAALIAAQVAVAQKLAKPSSGQQLQQKTMEDVPHCARKLGTISVVDGDDPSAWTQYTLAPPSKLLKVMVARSGCFNLVDRGSGLSAAERERAIGGNLGLQRGSNVGQGQIKAADYVLIAEIQGANASVSGGGVGAAAGSLLGRRFGAFGALAGGVRSKKMEANTVLSVTNVRTTETIATADGYAANNDIGFAAGGGGFFGSGAIGAVGGGYQNTDIGRMVTLSFIQAYAKLVSELGLVSPGDAGTAQASPKKTFSATGNVAMRKSPGAAAAVLRTLPPGAVVYPTGKQSGLWWEVADENDNVGWVLNTKLEPGR